VNCDFCKTLAPSVFFKGNKYHLLNAEWVFDESRGVRSLYYRDMVLCPAYFYAVFAVEQEARAARDSFRREWEAILERSN